MVNETQSKPSRSAAATIVTHRSCTLGRNTEGFVAIIIRAWLTGASATSLSLFRDGRNPEASPFCEVPCFGRFIKRLSWLERRSGQTASICRQHANNLVASSSCDGGGLGSASFFHRVLPSSLCLLLASTAPLEQRFVVSRTLSQRVR